MAIYPNTQLGFTTLPTTKPSFTASTSSIIPSSLAPTTNSSSTTTENQPEQAPQEQEQEQEEKLLHELHTLLLETQVMEGKLVCGNCGHEYSIKEGIANFLLPSHLV